MALIEKLNAIGDAIREKTGGTDKLTLDGMVEAIAGIQTGGGGGGSGGSGGVSWGTYTVTGKSMQDVEHGLGVTPALIIAMAIDSPNLLTTGVVRGQGSGHVFCIANWNGTKGIEAKVTAASTVEVNYHIYDTGSVPSSICLTRFTTNTFRFAKSLDAGTTYLWVAFAEDII